MTVLTEHVLASNRRLRRNLERQTNHVYEILLNHTHRLHVLHLLRRRRLVLLFASSVLCLRFIHGLWLLSTPSRGSWNAPTSPSFPLCDSPSGCTASCNSDTDGCSPRAPSNTTNKSILSPISVLWYLEIARTGIQFQIRLIHRLVTQGTRAGPRRSFHCSTNPCQTYFYEQRLSPQHIQIGGNAAQIDTTYTH